MSLPWPALRMALPAIETVVASSLAPSANPEKAATYSGKVCVVWNLWGHGLTPLPSSDASCWRCMAAHLLAKYWCGSSWSSASAEAIDDFFLGPSAAALASAARFFWSFFRAFLLIISPVTSSLTMFFASSAMVLCVALGGLYVVVSCPRALAR